MIGGCACIVCHTFPIPQDYSLERDMESVNGTARILQEVYALLHSCKSA